MAVEMCRRHGPQLSFRLRRCAGKTSHRLHELGGLRRAVLHLVPNPNRKLRIWRAEVEGADGGGHRMLQRRLRRPAPPATLAQRPALN
jgi:hypothetical protein